MMLVRALRISALLLFAAAPGSLALGGASADAPVLTLTMGDRHARDLKDGETHAYEIQLQGGDFVDVRVGQDGIRVAVSVMDPGDGIVLQTLAISGDPGPVPVVFVAPQPGVYRLEVRPAPPTSARGRYELHVEATRPPRPEDDLRAGAARALAAAVLLLEEPSQEQARRAVPLLSDALAGWRTLGERRLEADTLAALGLTHRVRLDDTRRAADYYQLELPLRRQLGDEAGEARALDRLAVVQMGLGGDVEEALALRQRALALHRAAGRRRDEAEGLDRLALTFIRLADFQRALEHALESLAIFRDLKDPLGEAVALTDVGLIYNRMGEWELAIDQYRRARELAPQHRYVPFWAAAQMGFAYLSLGDLGRARSSFDEARALIRQSPGEAGRASEANVVVGLGRLHRAEGSHEQAREMYEWALATYRTVGDRYGETAAHCDLGELHLATGNRDEARRSFQAALEMNRGASPKYEGTAHYGLGRAALEAGDLGLARQHAEHAVRIAESLRGLLSSREMRATVFASHQSRYALLVDVLMRQHDTDPAAGHDVSAFEVAERARGRSLLELLTEARIAVRQDVDVALVQEERTLKLRLAARSEAQARAQQAKDSARAGSLGQEIGELTARLADVEGRIQRSSPRYAALANPQPLTLREIQREVLDEGTLLLEYTLGETNSYLWVASPTMLHSFRLRPKREIEQASRAVYDLLARPNPVGQPSHEEYGRKAGALSRLILEPAAEALGNRRLLIVAPDVLQYVPFAALPDPRSMRDPMLTRHEIVSAPSASVVAVARREPSRRLAATGMVAVLADPVFDASDPRVRRRRAEARAHVADRKVASVAAATADAQPSALQRALRSVQGATATGTLTRLPFSRMEAEQIAAMATPDRRLKAVGFDASRATALGPDLARYRIVHFATHGLLDAQRPELSGVVLSLVDSEGRAQDGFLRLDDIYNLRLGADLVVLSGCQTGLGKVVQGEGLVGITRGFMYAGATRVVASLWQVDDFATSELMARFYRGLLRDELPPSAALRAAQLELSRMPQWRSPYHWASFVMQGEWR